MSTGCKGFVTFVTFRPIVRSFNSRVRNIGTGGHGTTLSVKAPDAAQIDILPFPKKIVESYRPFPFKARMGMGSFATFNPIPTPTLPLKGRGFAIIVLKVVP